MDWSIASTSIGCGSNPLDSANTHGTKSRFSSSLIPIDVANHDLNPPGRAGGSSSTRSVARSSAGASPATCAPAWSSTRSTWPASIAAPASTGSSATPTPGQYTSLRYTERLDEIGARPSIGTTADSYDNALAEAVNGLYKSELIRSQGPWRTVDDVELATLAWVHWFNTTRLHGTLGDIPPAEFEAAHYAQLATTG